MFTSSYMNFCKKIGIGWTHFFMVAMVTKKGGFLLKFDFLLNKVFKLHDIDVQVSLQLLGAKIIQNGCRCHGNKKCKILKILNFASKLFQNMTLRVSWRKGRHLLLLAIAKICGSRVHSVLVIIIILLSSSPLILSDTFLGDG